VAWFLGPFVIRGLEFPLGPDASVYMWWTRLAGVDGLSSVSRPGIPALAMVLQGTLHLPLVAVLAALECVLGSGVGLAAVSLVRAGEAETETEGFTQDGPGARRAVWLLAGLLTGTFAVHLATGYLANLSFSALFIGGAAAVTAGTRRATVAAALLLGAAALCHPLFFPLALAILAAAAVMGWREDRAEVRRVAAAAAGGTAILVAGSVALLAGPGPLSVITSRDGFLREVGLSDVIRSTFWYRFVHRWTRYVEWVSIPLAVYGWLEARAFVRRFLAAWGAVTIGGIAVGLITALFPADRIITFGYAIPILASYGLVRLWRALSGRRVVAALVTAGLAAAMIAGAFIAWARQEPFLSRGEIDAATVAGRYAAATPPGTALLFTVDDNDLTASFLATRAANVIRAAVPPDRIRDVHVVVPPVPAGRVATAERIALARVTGADAAAAVEASRTGSLTFLLKPFDTVDRRAPSMATPGNGVFVRAGPGSQIPAPSSSSADPLQSSSAGGIALATIAVLALVTAVGYGWATTFAPDLIVRLALAPLCGTAALVLAGIALERIGLPLTGSLGSSGVSVLAGGGGYLALFLLERRSRSNTPQEVHSQPHQ
jgi:hypothetical protein